jgi:hypothetical protein
MPTFERPVALMIPIVTVWLSWNGLPMATTYSPTAARDESPQGSVASARASIFTTAMSVTGSVPTSLPRKRRWSEVVMAIWFACSITWLLVTMRPSAPTMTPEPRLVLRSSRGMRRPGKSWPKKSRKKGSLEKGDRSAR